MRDIFEFIGDKMQLKKISGQRFSQGSFRIAFKSPGSKNGSDLSDCFCYEGPDIMNFMNDLISSMVILDYHQLSGKDRRFWPLLQDLV